MLTSLKVCGFRGFAKEGVLHFAIPNDGMGSGLTFLVGPNNSGKSTIVECLRYFNAPIEPQLSMGQRNFNAGDKVLIELSTDKGESLKLESVCAGSSQTRFFPDNLNPKAKIWIVPSRRAFNHFFSGAPEGRDNYLVNLNSSPYRSPMDHRFAARLFEAERNREAFDELLNEVLAEPLEWSIDLHDTGQHFLKLSRKDSFHSSEGMGDGIISLFHIIDSLYNSQPEEFIVIDEPELSLHPTLQRRLMRVLLRYSKDRQIVLSTHSPYFLDWRSLVSGGTLARFVHDSESSNVFQPPSNMFSEFRGLLDNLHNPHLLGTEANEVFFLTDCILLVEGQEDVVILRKLLSNKLQESPMIDFFGWGIGGAGNLLTFLRLFRGLGFQQVFVILDGDQKTLESECRKHFPNYMCHILPTEDIRDKPYRQIVQKSGIVNSSGKLKECYEQTIQNLSNQIQNYFNG